MKKIRKLSDREITRRGGHRESGKMEFAAAVSGWIMSGKSCIHGFKNDGRNKKMRSKVFLNAGFLHKTDTRLAPELTKELYSDRNRVSVTRLEKFCVLCICSFFKLRTAAFRPGKNMGLRRLISEISRTSLWRRFPKMADAQKNEMAGNTGSSS